VRTVTLRSALLTLFYSAIIIGFVSYILFQSRLLLGGPRLTIDPPPPAVIEGPTVTIAGLAENIVSITINDRPILTDERGYFKEDVHVPTGYTIVTVEARDRFGRTSTYTHDVVAQRPAEEEPITYPNDTDYGTEESTQEDSGRPE
jgi:hypothetical protein